MLPHYFECESVLLYTEKICKGCWKVECNGNANLCSSVMVLSTSFVGATQDTAFSRYT